MKIINVTPGLLPIPPKGWGAVEKIIWENHCNLLKLGIDSQIKYLDEVDNTADVVHIHVANLANMAHERGIPYYFMMHDHHSFLYGKNSDLYKENLKAIKNAKRAFVPAEYLVEYFDNEPEYFSHGVNTDFFKPAKIFDGKHKLLCVANNGYCNAPEIDRKGFGIAIKMAEYFNLPITIAGPKNNKTFFEKNNIVYDKLNVLYDLDEEQLLKLYQNHSIFIHMSELEAGHPNMTLLEAAACGLPIVGTMEDCRKDFGGMVTVKRDYNEGISALKQVIDNYKNYKDQCLKTAERLSWANRTSEMLKFYTMQNTFKSFKNKLQNSLDNTKRANLDYGGFLEKFNRNIKNESLPKFSFARTDAVINYKNEIKINYNFHNGAFLEILGDKKSEYEVSFIDKKDNSIPYRTIIQANNWTHCNKCHYVDYKIIVKEKGNIIFEHDLNLKDKKVYINFDTKSIGDHLAWMPCVEQFRKKHSCEIYCSTFFDGLFKDTYPELNFIKHSDQNSYPFYAKYNFGYFVKNEKARTIHPATLSLQEVACDILGLEHTRNVKPKLNLKNTGSNFKKPYVCFAMQSTSQAKYWNNKDGWRKVVDYLNSKGFDAVCIDKYRDFGSGKYRNVMPSNAVDKTGELPLENRINDLLNCKFFIGLGSGLSWLAWSCNKPVVLISGFSNPNSEFFTPYRVHNQNVCNSCWNDPEGFFNMSLWEHCPRKKDFECSKQITFEMVKEKIDLLISEYGY